MGGLTRQTDRHHHRHTLPGMSILPPGSEWPPQHYKPALDQVRHDAAVLSGDLAVQNDLYAEKQPKPYTSRFQYNGGLFGSIARGALGTPRPNNSTPAVTQFDTLPFDLATLSADVLVGEPPRFTVHPEDETNEQAVAELAYFTGTDTFAADLHQAFRSCAGLGWVYGRVVWDANIDPHPWIEWIDADQGMPEFTNGRLTAIIFWETYKTNNHVYRLLTRHTAGRIDYALYEGSEHGLGRVVPFTDCEETAYLADVVDADSGITTGATRPTAVLIPNLDRSPKWRTDPYLRYLGMSDVVKGGEVWHSLNMLWTDLMHEVDSAKAKLIVPEHYLRSNGPGRGMSYEWWRDVYTKPQSASADEAETIDRVQFDMRVQEYMDAIENTRMRAISSAGWSNITFGLENASAQMTATEIRARSTRTLHTHKAKSRFVRAGLGELLTAWLEMDAELNNYAPPTRMVDVSVAEPVQATELDEATTVQTLRTAGVASTRYAVTRLHPEWTDEQINEELAELQREQRAEMGVNPFHQVTIDAPPNGMDEG